MMTAKHIVPVRTNMAIFAALLVLTFATVGMDYLDMGTWNLVAAVTIASMKALLVVLYFMHLRYSPRLIWAFAGMGVFWLMILIGMTLDDVLTRGWDRPPQSWISG